MYIAMKCYNKRSACSNLENYALHSYSIRNDLSCWQYAICGCCLGSWRWLRLIFVTFAVAIVTLLVISIYSLFTTENERRLNNEQKLYFTQRGMNILKTDEVDLLLYEGNVSSNLPSLIQASSPSKDLVVYTSHLYRVENSSSFVIFLIGASQKVYKSRSIIGCGVGDRIATSFKVRYVYEDIRLHRWQKILKSPFHPYQQLVVECYGIAVKEGDLSFLLYYNTTTDTIVRVYSDYPVAIPPSRVAPSEETGNVSSVVCTKVLSRGVSWLPEFLRYQKSLGVDHVHIAILDTFIKDGGFRDILANNSFFLKAVRENFITIQIWKEWYNSTNDEWFYYGNILMYLDCIYRYRGTYDFVSLLDTDDFLTIRVPGLSYKEFLMQYCYKEGIGSCSFRWLFYSPGLCGMHQKVGKDGNVTKSMTPHNPRYEQNTNFKPIHRSNAIRDSSFHDASCSVCLHKGYMAILVPENVAYVAHNRLYSQYTKGQVCY